MSYLSNRDIPMMLREKTEFILDGRPARVVQSRVSDCLILWDEHTDAETGEVHNVKSDMLSCFDMGQMVENNRLHITAQPKYRPDGREILKQAAARQRSKDEHNRAFWRLSHIEAADELIAAGDMGQTRAEFERCIDAIKGRGNAKQTKRAKDLTGRKKAGFKYESMASPESGASVYRWHKKYKKHGPEGLYDRQGDSGNKSGRYSKRDLDFASDIITTRLNEERADIQSIVTSIQSATRVENRKRSRNPGLGIQLKVLGYDKVWHLIAQIAPVDHAIRTKGMEVAYKDLHCLGLGLQLTRPLERVEIDVYESDLMVFLDAVGAVGHLTDQEIQSMGLDGTPKRVRISAAIDVFTGCILAF